MAYISAQEILKRCFQNKSGKLKTSFGTYTVQDYFNAVYDEKNDSLRVSVDGLNIDDMISGGYWGNPVVSEDALPSDAKVNTLTPVISTSGVISFYYKTEDGWRNLPTLPLNKRQFIDWGTENKDDLMYLVENKKKLENILNGNFEIKEDIISLASPQITPVKLNIQGEEQDITDSPDSDNDPETYYRIDIDGYVLSTETYANNNALVSDKYYMKNVYNKNSGLFGKTSIYMDNEEYEYFSSLTPPKNVLKVYYLQKINPDGQENILETILDLSEIVPETVTVDAQGGVQIQNENFTHYCVKINGYVLSVESYPGNDSPLAEKNMSKMTYNRSEGEYGTTYLYFDKDEYEQTSSLTPPKNVFEVYYIQTPAVNENQSIQNPTVSNILSASQMPLPGIEYLNRVILCTNDCNVNGIEYVKGKFYECKLVDGNYVWGSI